MNFKHLLISSICLGAALSASADGEWLHVKTEKGWEVFSLENVDRLTFNDNAMTVSDKDGKVTATFARTSLSTMYVDNEEAPKESSGVDGIASDNASAPFSFDTSSKTVAILADGAFCIFATDGSTLLSIPQAKAGETVNLSRINGKIVILQSNGFTLKALLK